jgi:hypothetical protein
MQKPRPQSTQAPSCTTFLHKAFSLFQTPFKLLINNSFDENQHGPEVKIHLDKKISRSEQKSRQKSKAKRSSRKRRTLDQVCFSLLSFNECSWQMKSKATSPKEICWGPTIYSSKQN